MVQATGKKLNESRTNVNKQTESRKTQKQTDLGCEKCQFLPTFESISCEDILRLRDDYCRFNSNDDYFECSGLPNTLKKSRDDKIFHQKYFSRCGSKTDNLARREMDVGLYLRSRNQLKNSLICKSDTEFKTTADENEPKTEVISLDLVLGNAIQNLNELVEKSSTSPIGSPPTGSFKRCLTNEETPLQTAFYRAEMLVIARKICRTLFEDVPIYLELSGPRDFELYHDYGGAISECIQLLLESKSGLNRFVPPGFSSPDMVVAGSASKDNFDKRISTIKVSEIDHQTDFKMVTQLSEYWLDWSMAIQTIGFNFPYFARLRSYSAMRFYELAKLLLYHHKEILKQEPNIKSNIIDGIERLRSTEMMLEIEYEVFAQLMPLPVFEKSHEIHEQLSCVCAEHFQNEGLIDFFIEERIAGLSRNRKIIKFFFSCHF